MNPEGGGGAVPACVREERKIAFIAWIMALLRKHTHMHEQTRRRVSSCQLSNNKTRIFTSVLLCIKKKIGKPFYFLMM